MSDELNIEALAIAFHDAYERRAGGFNYETRGWTRWEDVPPENQRLMRAVVGEVARPLLSKLASLTEENERLTKQMNAVADDLGSERARASRYYDVASDLERKLRGAEARADRNRDETLSTIKDLAEAEQRAARYEAALKRAYDDLRFNEWGGDKGSDKRFYAVQEVRRALQPPNPESEHLHRFGEHGTCECGATPDPNPESETDDG